MQVTSIYMGIDFRQGGQSAGFRNIGASGHAGPHCEYLSIDHCISLKGEARVDRICEEGVFAVERLCG